jgi:hypothetical protein
VLLLSERFEELEKRLSQIERVSNVVSLMLTSLLTLSLMCDVLGISFAELVHKIVTLPWVIPVEVILQYYWLWYTLEVVLLVLLIIDQVTVYRFLARNIEPPKTYVLYMNTAMFLISFWLALVLRTATLMLIAFLSSFTLIYTLMKR